MQFASCTPDFTDLIGECYEESFLGLELEPSAEAVALCTAMAKPLFECSWFTTPQGCARFHSVFSAPALAAEQACATASCEELDGCIDAELFSFGE